MGRTNLSTEIYARTIRQPVIQHENVEMPGLVMRFSTCEGVHHRQVVVRKDDIEELAGLNIILNDEKAFLLH